MMPAAASVPDEPDYDKLRFMNYEPGGSDHSEDEVALLFVGYFGNEYRYLAPLNHWLRWDGNRWARDSTGHVSECIRNLVRAVVKRTLPGYGYGVSSSFIAGVEKLLRTDQRIVVEPGQLNADPWALNTQSGIVDLRTGQIGPHDPAALITRIANAHVDREQGGALWMQFISDITQGDAELAGYLQRFAGYAATGVTTEDVLAFLYGDGANGKSSFAEAVVHVLGDYAMIFAPEVLMESRGDRHPTELAQFMGVRLALSSEPNSRATWNDSRVKALTGDAAISARFMRGDHFTFRRSHKTLLIGNHLPQLGNVSHAIRRRMQMVPFRAVFEPQPGVDMREKLRTQAAGAILAWIVEGARQWKAMGTSPPEAVRSLSAEYITEQDGVGRWLNERCDRIATATTRSSELYLDYKAWCVAQGASPQSNMAFSQYLAKAFTKCKRATGNFFVGLELTDGGYGASSHIPRTRAHTHRAEMEQPSIPSIRHSPVAAKQDIPAGAAVSAPVEVDA